MTSLRDIHRVHAERERAARPTSGTFVIYADADGNQQTRTWPNALPGHRSPCRPDTSKGLRQHRCSAAHASAVEGYRAIREAELAQAEAETHGYETELAEYWERHPRTTFKVYLQGMRDETRQNAAA